MTYERERLVRLPGIRESMNIIFYGKEDQDILGGIRAGDLG